MSFEHIKRQDPAVYASIMNELQRQRDYWRPWAAP